MNESYNYNETSHILSYQILNFNLKPVTSYFQAHYFILHSIPYTQLILTGFIFSLRKDIELKNTIKLYSNIFNDALLRWLNINSKHIKRHQKFPSLCSLF